MDTLAPITVTGPLLNTPDDLARRHRSAWAAAVCDGGRTLELRPGSAAPALAEALEGDRASWQAVVWLEGIEASGPTAEELERLRTAADSGYRIVLVLPAERTRPSADLAREVAGVLGGTPLIQRLAEGSLIHPADERPDRIAASIEDAAIGDPADARAWLVTANIPNDALGRAERAVAALALSPVHGAYLERLEAANAGLRLANARLARENLGKHDSAAASIVLKLQRARDDAQDRAAELEAEVQRLASRLEQEVEIARRNDQLFQDARRQLLTRPHRLMSGLQRRLGWLPFLKRFFR